MKKILAVILSLCFLLPVAACKKQEAPPQAVETPKVSLDEIEKIYETDPNAAAWKMIEGMSLDERIYQLFIVCPETLSGGTGVTELTDSMREGFAKYPVGGVVLFGDNIQNREQVTKLISDMQNTSKYPLFVAVDEEGGTVSRLSKISGFPSQPPMREVGDSGDGQRAYEIGKTTATEMREMGFNVNFAPCADTLVNPDNAEIGSRSFGTDAAVVSTMVENVVKGLREGGVASTVKHFPGHGSAESDSHSGRAVSTRSYDDISAVDLLPFKAGIEAGTDFVMISHMVNESITKTNMECSMSTNVMTNILRNTMGYTKIIITDSLSMGAITLHFSAGAAAVTALEAGADVLLMPANVEEAAAAIRGAMESGRISEMRLNESVARVLKVKLERGIL